jgi:2-oxoglutarate ferredoxin oxidoreductase subunit delta
MKEPKKTRGKERAKTGDWQIRVLKERCKGCGFCIEFCPRKVIHESAEFNRKGYHPVYVDSNSDCTGCRLCELLCPEFALSVVPRKKEETND